MQARSRVSSNVAMYRAAWHSPHVSEEPPIQCICAGKRPYCVVPCRTSPAQRLSQGQQGHEIPMIAVATSHTVYAAGAFDRKVAVARIEAPFTLTLRWPVLTLCQHASAVASLFTLDMVNATTTPCTPLCQPQCAQPQYLPASVLPISCKRLARSINQDVRACPVHVHPSPVAAGALTAACAMVASPLAPMLRGLGRAATCACPSISDGVAAESRRDSEAGGAQAP